MCSRCGEKIELDFKCGDHNGLCCDCYDVRMGVPLEFVNKLRAQKGKGPLPEDVK